MRRSPVAVLLPLVVLIVGAGVGVAVVLRQRPPHPLPVSVAIRSAGDPAVMTVEALVDESPLVVIARVTAVRSGRRFADRPELVGVRSQLVEQEIGAVLAGVAPFPTIVVEEEATLGDGRRVVVDGRRPAVAGHRRTRHRPGWW